jgi:hypothetical protein
MTPFCDTPSVGNTEWKEDKEVTARKIPFQARRNESSCKCDSIGKCHKISKCNYCFSTIVCCVKSDSQCVACVVSGTISVSMSLNHVRAGNNTVTKHDATPTSRSCCSCLHVSPSQTREKKIPRDNPFVHPPTDILHTNLTIPARTERLRHRLTSGLRCSRCQLARNVKHDNAVSFVAKNILSPSLLTKTPTTVFKPFILRDGDTKCL